MRFFTLILAATGLAAAAAPFVNAVAIAAADFNGDGKPDLVVANSLDGSVSVLLGNGDGTFAPATSIAVGGTPFALATGDWDGGGYADILVNNRSAVVALFGNGDGTFTPPLRLPTGPLPAGFALGDLNGDGKPDLVATSSVPIVSVTLNGELAARTLPLPNGGGPPSESVAIADVNGDGKPDLVVTNVFSNAVTIFLGHGDGNFDGPKTFAANGGPTMLAVVDLNGDKKPDIAVSLSGSGFAVLGGHGDGAFDTGKAFPFGAECEALAVADFNQDGLPDLAVLSRSPLGARLLVATSSGSAAIGAETWQSTQTVDLPLRDARGIVAGDFNQDGIPDLAIAHGLDNAVSILLGNGDGTFAAPAVLGGADPDQAPPAGAVVIAAMSDGAVAVDLEKKTWGPAIAGSSLTSVAASADGEQVYVSSATTIAAADRSLTALATMPVTGLPPQALVLSRDSSLLYAAAARQVDVFDTASGRRVTSIPIGPGRGTAVLSKDNSRLVVSIGDDISVIDTAKNTILPITDPNSLSLAISPDSRKLYVGNTFDSPNGICNVPDAALLQVFDLETGSKLAEAHPGGASCMESLALSANGATLYAGDPTSSAIRVIDTASLQQTATIALPNQIGVNGLALMPDGSQLVAATARGLVVIDVAANQVKDTIPLPFGVSQIAILPARAAKAPNQ